MFGFLKSREERVIEKLEGTIKVQKEVLATQEEHLESLQKQLEFSNSTVAQATDLITQMLEDREALNQDLLELGGIKSASASLAMWMRGLILLYLYTKGGQAEIDEDFVKDLALSHEFEVDENNPKLYKIKGFTN